MLEKEKSEGDWKYFELGLKQIKHGLSLIDEPETNSVVGDLHNGNAYFVENY